MDHNFKNIVELLEESALNKPDFEEFTFLNFEKDSIIRDTLSFSQLAQRAKSVASTIQKNSKKGDRVLLIYQPGIDFIIAFYACLYSGTIATPVYPPYSKELTSKLEKIIKIAKPKLILSTKAITEKIKMLGYVRLAEGIPVIRDLARYFGGHTYNSAKELILIDFTKFKWIVTDLNVDNSHHFEPINIEPDNLAFLQFTSGSTEQPKGVMLSHGNVLENLSYIHKGFSIKKDDSLVLWLPPYHDMGLIGGLLTPLMSGYPITLLSPIAFLQEPKRWLETISNTKATLSGGPNFAYDLCVKKVKEEDLENVNLESWEVAFVGAEPVRPNSLENFYKKFAPAGFKRNAFYICYGLAEATLMVTGDQRGQGYETDPISETSLKVNKVDPANNNDCKLMVCCGLIGSGTEVIIVDHNKKTKKSDREIGEVWVRSDYVAKGYWDMPEESDAAFHAYLADGNGPYLRTGDLGYLDKGKLFITGRKKDVIIIRGENYYPHDIEHSLQTCHPGIRTNCCAAFSIEKDDREQFVILQEVNADFHHECEEIAKKIMDIVIRNHGIHPDVVMLLDKKSIPKTTSGKIQRNRSKKRFLQGKFKPIYSATYSNSQNSHHSQEEASANFESRLKTLLSDIIDQPLSSLDQNSRLADLAMDSVQIIEFQYRFNKEFDYLIPIETILAGTTISDIKKLIESHDSNIDVPKKVTVDLNAEIDSIPICIPENSYIDTEFKTILLTGATGYLGLYILKYLLEATQMKIFCLIRATSKNARFFVQYFVSRSLNLDLPD